MIVRARLRAVVVIRVKANLGRDRFRPPLEAVMCGRRCRVRSQWDWSRCFCLPAVAVNGSGCGCCLLNEGEAAALRDAGHASAPSPGLPAADFLDSF